MRLRSESLIHDEALNTAKAVLPVIGHLLREEEWRDALEEIYLRVKAGMERYHAKLAWLASRIGGDN